MGIVKNSAVTISVPYIYIHGVIHTYIYFFSIKAVTGLLLKKMLFNSLKRFTVHLETYV